MRARTLLTALACSASLLTAVAPAGAQVVIMRKMMPFKPGAEPVFESPVTTTPGSEPVVVNPNAYYSWVVSPWKQVGVCGSQGVQTRVVSCKRTDGTIVPDSRCVGNGSGPKPIASQPTEITQTCGYQWDAGAWVDPGSSCTSSEPQTRDVVCRRSDGKVAEDAACGDGKPARTQSVADYSACTFKWSTGAWSDPTSQCGASTQTRGVLCVRSDGTKASEDMCAAAGAKPPETQEAYVVSGCAANWMPSPWGSPVPACGTSTQTRDVPCVRADGVAVDAAQCTLEKPATSQPVKDYTTCIDGRTPENPFGWTVGEYGAFSTTCGQAVRTRSVTCTDDDGKAVAETNCRLTKPVASVSSYETSSCTLSWQIGDYGPVQPACGATVSTRSVVCMRSDGKPQSDSSCGTRPQSTQPATDYSACTFGWATGAWSPWSSTCGAGVQTRSVGCQRSDGTAADEALCRQTKPASTQDGYQTTGCSFSWKIGPYDSPSACGDVTQTRSVQCVRSDGEVIDDATCAAVVTKPVTTTIAKDYTACSYSWAVGAYGAWSTTCGRATSNRSVVCQRSDGSTVSDASCASVGTKPIGVQTSDQTASCTFSWVSGPYGNVVPACGASVQNRTVTCTRSDGTAADPASCTGTKPVSQQAATDYNGCGFTWEVGSWNSAELCGESATQTRSVQCRRSDGTAVADGSCIVGGSGPKPAVAQTVSSFSGCGYAWKTTTGAWSSTCSDSATRINTVVCQRSDGAAADDSMCAGQAPPRQETQGVYSSCTFAATYSTTFGACTPTATNSPLGIQTAPITSCVRSDGTTVANSLCNPQVTSKSCSTSTGDRYVREAYYLKDPASYSPTVPQINVSNSSSVRLLVNSLICWDYTNSTSVVMSSCSTAKGVQTYDIVTVPATYVSDLREIWVDQSNLLAAAPHAVDFVSYSISQMCTGGYGGSLQVKDPSTGQNSSWTLRCGKPDTSNHYARSPYSLGDPVNVLSSFPQLRWANPSYSGTSVKLAVQGTICRDTITGQNAAAAKCQYLPGPSVYDLTSVPAVYVKDLREIYVTQADLQTALGYGTYFDYRYSVSSVCTSGFGILIGPSNSDYQSWTLRCGTPDRPDRYVRSPYTLTDPASVFNSSSPYYRVNVNNASSLRLGVQNTICRDTTTGQNAASTKCQYLLNGANIYDLASVPATFVADLREIYVNREDLQSALGFGSYIGNNALNSACNGYGMAIWDGSQFNTWTMKCGVADTPDHYQRYAYTISDPTSVFNSSSPNYKVNTTSETSVFRLAVLNTSCRDMTTGTNVSSKCTYLPTGANVGDIKAIPATYVKELRDIYVSQADLQSALGLGSYIGNSSVASACNGYGVAIWDGSTFQTWTMKCSAPDSPDHYVRSPYSLDDPTNVFNSGSPNYKANTTAETSVLRLGVLNTLCRDTTTGQNASSTKCQYLSSGANIGDLKSIPATYVKDLREVYVSQADLQAALGYGAQIRNTSITSACNGYSLNIWDGTTFQTWTMRCSAPDAPGNYQRVASSYADAYSYYQDASKRTLNDTTKPAYWVSVNGTQCRNVATGASVSGKCDYLPTGAKAYDVMSVSASWNTTAKTATVSKADLKALSPLASDSAFMNTVCGRSFTVANGTTGTYTLVCQ